MKMQLSQSFLEATGREQLVFESLECSCPLCASGDFVCMDLLLEPELSAMNRTTKYYHAHVMNVEPAVPTPTEAQSNSEERPCAAGPAEPTAGETLDSGIPES